MTMNALVGEKNQAPYGSKSKVAYADPGYQADKVARYPIDTVPHSKSAWAYISQQKNAVKYTPAQLKRIKGRIKAALGKFGITPAAEGWAVDAPIEITEALVEFYGGDPDSCGSYSLSATNGPTTVTVCSYGLDPADLHVVLAQACSAASAALCSIDPDMDGDIDLPGADAEDDDGDADALASRIAAAIRGESAEDPAALVAEAMAARNAAAEAAASSDPAPEPAAANHGTEAPVSESTPTTEAAVTVPAALTQADLDGAVARALAADKAARKARKAAKAAPPAETAPAAQVTETEDQRIARLVDERVAAAVAAQAVTETEDQRIDRLVEEKLTAAKQQLTESGQGPSRKGLAVTEHSGGKPAEPGLNSHGFPSDWPDKPAHQFTDEERQQYFGPALVRHTLGAKADLLG